MMKVFLISLGLTGVVLFRAPAQTGITAEQRSRQIADRIIVHKNNPSRVQLYKFYSGYFVSNNIYPNADAIDLVDAYNKQATYEDILEKRVDFKSLMLPPLTEKQVQYHKQEYLLMTKRVMAVNDLFKKAAAQFVQKLPAVSAAGHLPQAFIDSLQQFGNKILPGINNQSANIPSLQLSFFLTSLNHINQFLDQLSGGDDEAVRATVGELMEDFYAYPVAVMKNFKSHLPAAFDARGTGLYQYAVYRNDDLIKHAAPAEMELPNANVYVYTRGADGKWSQAPKPDAFNVYYGANGFKYSLKPGCDTLSFFTFHPLEPASTLPVVLPRGNVCFVLQDVNTKRLIIKPDINLRDNKEVDDKQLIKLCFKVEN